MAMQEGKFITLEGVDGAGKSTHVEWLAAKLASRGVQVTVTREPGGTPLGEKLRALVLAEPMHIDTEALLMFAARREHLERVIMPALRRGHWVLSDRFTDATFAYQGAGRGMPLDRIAALESWVHPGFQPDLTLVFHVSVEVAEARRGGRPDGGKDKFEQLDRDFFNRVSRLYLDRAENDPVRMRVIDASRTIPEIQKELEEIILSI
jgi:dTMP kinase